MHLDWVMPANMWHRGMLEGFGTLHYPTMEQMIGTADPEWASRIKGLLVGFLDAQPQMLGLLKVWLTSGFMPPV